MNTLIDIVTNTGLFPVSILICTAIVIFIMIKEE